jgi:RNA polymerase sigma factor (sigma-70 family)
MQVYPHSISAISAGDGGSPWAHDWLYKIIIAYFFGGKFLCSSVFIYEEVVVFPWFPCYVWVKGYMADDFEALYKKYSSMVFRCCLKLLRREEDVEEVVNDVFTRLFLKEKEGRIINSYPLYLYKTATNVCFNRLRAIALRRKKYEGFGDEEDLYRYERSLSRYYERDKSFTYGEKLNESELVNNKLYAEAFLLSLLEDEEDNTEVSQVLEICHYYYFDKMGPKEIGETMGMSVPEVEKLFETRHIYFMYYFDDMTIKEIAKIKGMSLSGIHKRLEKIRRRIDQLRKEEGNKTE